MATSIPILPSCSATPLHVGDLVVAPVVRTVEGHAEAIRVAGLDQQRLGFFGVVRRRLVQFRRIAVDARGDDHAGGDEQLAHQVVEDRLEVDRVGHRLAHPLVLERIAAP